MQIHSLQATGAASSVQRAAAKPMSPIQSAPAVSSTTADQLDLSAQAQQISQSQLSGSSQSTDAIRTDKVASLRQAIAGGGYETPEKLSAALDKMLDTFA